MVSYSRWAYSFHGDEGGLILQVGVYIQGWVNFKSQLIEHIIGGSKFGVCLQFSGKYVFIATGDGRDCLFLKELFI